ncbi:MAG TPA: hypothetical protein VH741_07610, partial [Candidatus Limnocylindrales bacterium]
VALPGPPREMWPMWRDHVRPRLAERGSGAEVASETLRCAGIGESALAELIGEEVLRRAEPEVATYARPDAVDVRVSAHGPGAEQRVAAAVDELLGRIGDHVFARGAETWPEVIRRLLGGRTLALVEAGSGGQLLALLGAAPYVVGGELVGPDEFDEHGPAGLAERVRSRAGADVGLAVRTTAGRADTRVDVAIATATGAVHEQTRTAFLAGPEGQRRAALVAVTELWRWLSTDNYAHG